jgi:hypothetical protein
MRVTGPCPARPRSRGGQARPLLPLATLEHLLRPPTATVRGTLDQAAHLLATLPGRGEAHWPLIGTAPDGSRRAGYGPLRQDRRHLPPCQVHESWRGIQRSGRAGPSVGTEAVGSAAVGVSDYWAPGAHCGRAVHKHWNDVQ